MPDAAHKNINLAELSDEDIATLDYTTLPENATGSAVADSNARSASDTGVEDTTSDETVGTVPEDVSSTPAVEGADSTSANIATDTGTAAQTPEEPITSPAVGQTAESAVVGSKGTVAEPSTVDYKAEYAKVMAPFRAAKREIQVDNIDDARRLMQMGVDYSRKMEAMKPYQRVLQTLEKNNLLDISRLNFLIDLDKKNPEAIKKFLKDSNIDPMELSLEDNTKPYRPTDHMVGDQEVLLNEVLESIRHTDSFDRTADVIAKQWDTASRKVLYEDPRIIQALNGNIASGVFDQITAVVEKERLLGRLVGLSDLEAYKTVGDAIQAQGGFKPNLGKETSPVGTTPQPSQNSGSQSAKADDLRNRRRAASSPKGAASVGKVRVDLSKLSDEEIEKMDYTTL